MHTFRRVAYRITGGMIDLRSGEQLIVDYHKRRAREPVTFPHRTDIHEDQPGSDESGHKSR